MAWGTFRNNNTVSVLNFDPNGVKKQLPCNPRCSLSEMNLDLSQPVKLSLFTDSKVIYDKTNESISFLNMK